MAGHLPTALTGLTPREAIADAVYRCLIGIDSNDVAMMESSFVQGPEASFEIEGGPKMQGSDAMKESVLNHVGPMDTQHILTNIRIQVEDGADTASMTAYALNQHFRTGEGPAGDKPRWLTGSTYFIDLVKDAKDGLWKIKTWKMRLIWREGDSSVMGRG